MQLVDQPWKKLKKHKVRREGMRGVFVKRRDDGEIGAEVERVCAALSGGAHASFSMVEAGGDLIYGRALVTV
jgi:hypothetical protein